MLGKLLKYEFKSTSRIMWILYGALIVVAILLGLLIRLQIGPENIVMGGGAYEYSISDERVNSFFNTTMVILGMAYVLMVQAIAVVTVIMIILRFSKNLLGGEGYLMHTLPVSTTSLISSKLIISILWIVIAVVAGLLSFLAFGATSGAIGIIIEGNLWGKVIESLRNLMNWHTVLAMITGVVVTISSILELYVSMAIGNLANKNKFILSVGAYIAIQVLLTILSVIYATIGENSLFGYGGMTDSLAFLDSLMIKTMIIRLIMIICAFTGTTYILKNKLNLA